MPARTGDAVSTGAYECLDVFQGEEDPWWDADTALDARGRAAGGDAGDDGRLWFAGASSDSDSDRGHAQVEAGGGGQEDYAAAFFPDGRGGGNDDDLPAAAEPAPAPFGMSPSVERALDPNAPAGHSARPAARTAPRFGPASMMEPFHVPPTQAPGHRATQAGGRGAARAGQVRPAKPVGGSARRDELMRGGHGAKAKSSAAASSRNHGPSRFTIRDDGEDSMAVDDVAGGGMTATRQLNSHQGPSSTLSPPTLPLAARLRLLSPVPTGTSTLPTQGGGGGLTQGDNRPMGGRATSLVHRLAAVEADLRARKHALERGRSSSVGETHAQGGHAPVPLPPGAIDVVLATSRKEADVLVLSCTCLAGQLPGQGAGRGDSLQLVVPCSVAAGLNCEGGLVLRVHPPLCCIMPGVLLASWNLTVVAV